MAHLQTAGNLGRGNLARGGCRCNQFPGKTKGDRSLSDGPQFQTHTFAKKEKIVGSSYIVLTSVWQPVHKF